MSDILFLPRAPVAPRSPNRADIALFVGSVQRRLAAAIDPVSPRARATDRLYSWLDAGGWTLPSNRSGALPLEELLDVPVPIERWSDFDRLFDWQSRPLEGGVTGACYLGAAVRSFFAEGGSRCYVVRTGDPWPITATRAERDAEIVRLVPQSGGRALSSPVDRSTWRGVWHLHGLSDVSFVSLPDLADAVADSAQPLAPLPVPVASEERFVECSTSTVVPSRPAFARRIGAPRCDEAGYRRWARTLGIVLDALARAGATSTLREVQLVAAVPLPDRQQARAADVNILEFLRQNVGLDQDLGASGLASSFLQLAYPWLRTRDSALLPEGLENPEAALIGLLAQNALSRGSFRCAAGLATRSVLGIEPRLSAHETASRLEVSRRLGPGSDSLVRASLDDAEQLAGEESKAPGGPELVTPVENLRRRVSLIGPTPAGFALLSDVTTAKDASYRQAQLGRLVVAIIRAARQVGNEETFAPSAPAAWSALRSRIGALLSGLWRAGALRGESERDAYQVRCDRSTMSDDDIDRGRLIAEVSFDAAVAIERISVSLSLGDGRGLGSQVLG